MSTLRRLVGSRRARRDAQRFVIEGPRLIRDAATAGLAIDVVVVPDDDAGAAALEEVLAVGATGAELVSVAPGVFTSLADTVTPQPALAVAAMPAVELGPLVAGPDPAVLVLVDVADPGNAGTLIRSAEATGCQAVVVCGSSVDCWSPKVVRASAGSGFRLPVVELATVGEAVERLKTAGLAIVALDQRTGAAPDAVDLTGSVAVLVGSEAHGLPPSVVAAADNVVAIPMAEAVESLNAAVAASVVLFERTRQRRGRTVATADSMMSDALPGA